MKILVVSSYLPYPLHSGGHVRLYNLIRELSDQHEITLICEKRPHQTASDSKEVEKICKKVITVDRRKQWSIKNIAKSALSPHSFLTTGHLHPEMQRKIREELEDNSFDLIHVETFYVMQNLPHINRHPGKRGTSASRISYRSNESDSGPRQNDEKYGNINKSIPIVLVEHNIEYQVYQRFVDRAPAPLRPLLALDIAKIKREEKEAWRKATALVAVSEEDKKVMAEAGLDAAIIANGVDIESFTFKAISNKQEVRSKKILFIGDFKWIQNQDSAKFIIQEVWPKIKEQLRRHSGKRGTSASGISYRSNESDSGRRQNDGEIGQNDEGVKLWIVARSIPDSILSLTDDSDVLFDVESSNKQAPEIFQEASVLLAPIRVGGGSSYKILESMACGTPVVTMQMSASAIHAKDGEHLMVGQTAEELAQKTLHVLQNNETYERISRKGRELIEEKYSWKMIAEELEKVYRSVIPSEAEESHTTKLV